MEQRLQALENVGKAELETLARSRAEQVRALLLRQSPGLAKRISLAVKGGSPLVRAGTAAAAFSIVRGTPRRKHRARRRGRLPCGKKRCVANRLKSCPNAHPTAQKA